MRKFTKVLANTQATAPAPNVRCLVIPFEARRKSRQVLKLESGEEIGLLLPPGTVLHQGDLLEADDGFQLEIQAAEEELMMATAKDPFLLLRAGYHLGNRHASIELRPGSILLPVDPVLRDMLVGLGLNVTLVSDRFSPETGAYGGGHKHGHDETFAEDYALAQRAFHEHEKH